MVNTEEVISAAPWILPQLPHCWQYVQVDLECAKHKVSSNVMLRRLRMAGRKRSLNLYLHL